MQGTRKIFKQNIILDNIIYIAINASGKSIVKLKFLCFWFVFLHEVCVCV